MPLSVTKHEGAAPSLQMHACMREPVKVCVVFELSIPGLQRECRPRHVCGVPAANARHALQHRQHVAHTLNALALCKTKSTP